MIGFFNKEVPASKEMMERTAPNLFDLMIALGGGAAGAYAVISPRLSVAFVGVAIATALVPPLATCSLFLARGEFALSGGAFLLALANIVGIQFASSVVFYLNGFRYITKGKKLSRGVLVEDMVSVAVLLVLGDVLTATLHGLVTKELYERAVRNVLKATCSSTRVRTWPTFDSAAPTRASLRERWCAGLRHSLPSRSRRWSPLFRLRWGNCVRNCGYVMCIQR